MPKEGHFLAGTGTSGYFGDLENRGMNPNLNALQVTPGDKYMAWPLSLKRLLKVQSGDLLWKFSAKQIEKHLYDQLLCLMHLCR